MTATLSVAVRVIPVTANAVEVVGMVNVEIVGAVVSAVVTQLYEVVHPFASFVAGTIVPFGQKVVGSGMFAGQIIVDDGLKLTSIILVHVDEPTSLLPCPIILKYFAVIVDGKVNLSKVVAVPLEE